MRTDRAAHLQAILRVAFFSSSPIGTASTAKDTYLCTSIQVGDIDLSHSVTFQVDSASYVPERLGKVGITQIAEDLSAEAWSEV